MTRIVVLGTGTEIGKTHASITLTKAIADLGVSVAGLKPIESGVPADPTDASNTDAAMLAAVSSIPVQPQPYALRDPVSPHLAARRAGVVIDLDVVTAWVDAHAAKVVIVETAGAVLSPVTDRLTNLDLARALRPDHILLVAPDRLGVLHDVMATVYVLRTLAPELPRPTLLLQAPALPDSSTGTNAAEIELLGIARKAHVFQRAKPGDGIHQQVARNMLAEFDLPVA